MSLVSGLSTVLGAVLVLLRARLTSAPLSSAHLAFTSGLACSVMVAVSVGQMLLPASLTSEHCIGPLHALSICAASAALSIVAIRQAPIDRLLASMGLSSASLLQPSSSSSSPPFTPPLTPSTRAVSSGSGTNTPLTRPSSPLRHSAAGSATSGNSGSGVEQTSSRAANSAMPPFLQRYANSNSNNSSSSTDGGLESAEDTVADDGGESGGSSDGSSSGSGSGITSREEVRLMIPSAISKQLPFPPHQYPYHSSSPPLFRSSASLLPSSPASLSTLRLGVLTALLLAVHNLPEGLAVFVSSFDDQQAGLAMALALSAHNIPEVRQSATHSVCQQPLCRVVRCCPCRCVEWTR